MPREEIRFVRPLNSLFARSSSALQTTLVVGMFGITAVMPNVFTRHATAMPVAPVQDPNSEPGQDPAAEPSEEPGQDPADEPMNSDPGDPADDPIEEPVEEPAAPAPKKPDAPAPKKSDAPAPKKAAPKKPAQTEPAQTEPAPTEPAPTEPAPTEPAPAAEPAADDAPLTVDTEQIRDAAQAAMKKGEWSQAANGWATLLQFLPGDEEATRERARAQSMLEGGTVIGSVSSDREVRRQQATAQFSSDMKRSQSLLAPSQARSRHGTHAA